MALTGTFVRNARRSGKPAGDKYGEGMYLLVKAAGKYWRLDYRHLGKRKTPALGMYPDVSLAKARQRRAIERPPRQAGHRAGVPLRGGRKFGSA